ARGVGRSGLYVITLRRCLNGMKLRQLGEVCLERCTAGALEEGLVDRQDGAVGFVIAPLNARTGYHDLLQDLIAGSGIRGGRPVGVSTKNACATSDGGHRYDDAPTLGRASP